MSILWNSSATAAVGFLNCQICTIWCEWESEADRHISLSLLWKHSYFLSFHSDTLPPISQKPPSLNHIFTIHSKNFLSFILHPNFHIVTKTILCIFNNPYQVGFCWIKFLKSTIFENILRLVVILVIILYQKCHISNKNS